VLQLSKYPALNNLEKQTSVPKVYVVLGLGALYFFLIFFNIAGEFLVNIAGFSIPAYYSLSALFSASKVDDTQVRLSASFVTAVASSCITKMLTYTVVDGTHFNPILSHQNWLFSFPCNWYP
jgi:hypothetical protein